MDTEQKFLQNVIETGKDRRDKLSVIFSPLTQDDIPLVTEIERRIYPEAVRTEDFEEELGDALEDPEHNASFVMKNRENNIDVPIGYAIAYGEESELDGEDGPVLYVSDLALLPEYQRKGAGRAMLYHLLEIAEQHRLPIEFHAREGTSYQALKHAEGELASHGYRITHDEFLPDFYNNDDRPEAENAHFVRLEKNLE